jgi:hypothetical protein
MHGSQPLWIAAVEVPLIVPFVLAKEICKRNCLALMYIEFTHHGWRIYSDDVVKTRGIKSRDIVWAL